LRRLIADAESPTINLSWSSVNLATSSFTDTEIHCRPHIRRHQGGTGGHPVVELASYGPQIRHSSDAKRSGSFTVHRTLDSAGQRNSFLVDEGLRHHSGDASSALRELNALGRSWPKRHLTSAPQLSTLLVLTWSSFWRTWVLDQIQSLSSPQSIRREKRAAQDVK